MQSLVDCTFSGVVGYKKEYNDQLALFVAKTIMNISWFFKVPFFIYIYFIGFIAILLKLKPLTSFSSEQKINFYNNIVLKLPFSGSLDKLIRSLGFMKLYDLAAEDN